VITVITSKAFYDAGSAAESQVPILAVQAKRTAILRGPFRSIT